MIDKNSQFPPQENEGPPPSPLSVRLRVRTGTWFLWDSFAEKQVGKPHLTIGAAENALVELLIRRRTA